MHQSFRARHIALALLAAALPLVFGNHSALAQTSVRPVLASSSQGLQGQPPVTINVWEGFGTNINFIPTGEVIRKIWLDDPSRLVLDTDGCLGPQSQNTEDCGATVVHLRQIKRLNFPNLLASPSPLLTLITEGPAGRKLYQFRLVLAKGKPQYHTINIYPDNKPETLIEVGGLQRASADDVERGLKVAEARKLIRRSDPLWTRARNFAALLRNGESVSAAAQAAGISPTLVSQLAQWGLTPPAPPLQPQVEGGEPPAATAPTPAVAPVVQAPVPAPPVAAAPVPAPPVASAPAVAEAPAPAPAAPTPPAVSAPAPVQAPPVAAAPTPIAPVAAAPAPIPTPVVQAAPAPAPIPTPVIQAAPAPVPVPPTATPAATTTPVAAARSAKAASRKASKPGVLTPMPTSPGEVSLVLRGAAEPVSAIPPEEPKVLAAAPVTSAGSPVAALSRISIPLKDGGAVGADRLLEVQKRIWNWQGGKVRKQLGTLISALVSGEQLEQAIQRSGLSLNEVQYLLKSTL